MTFAQLSAFVRILEFGSVSKAAAVLRIAQPALSRQMKALEEDLGAVLLDRHAWGVSATPAGELLLEHARRILREADAARTAIDGLSSEPSGSFALGASASFAHVALPALAQRIRARYPKLKLQLVDGFSATLHQWALSGRLDLAVLYEEATGPLPSRPLLTERLVLVGPAGALGGKPQTADDLLARPMILPARPNRLRLLVEAFAPGIEPVLELDSLRSLLELVRRGEGFTVLPRSTVRSAVSQGVLSTGALHPACTRTLITAYPPHRATSPAREAVEAELRALVAEMAPRLGWTSL